MSVSVELVSYLENIITEERKNLFNKLLEFRTRYLTVVLEDLYQPHNASAVLRSCDCFGIQDVNIIENYNEYKVNSDIALGSSNWLTLNRYNSVENNTLAAISDLRSKGYRIIATTPHTNDIDLPDFNIEKGKSAIFFGTEKDGVSNDIMDNADEFLKIPMYGFTESFNISVSAGIILYQLSNLMRQSNVNWQLNDKEKLEIKHTWLKSSIKKVEMIEQGFRNKTNYK